MRVPTLALVMTVAAFSALGSALAVPGGTCSFAYDVACTHTHATEGEEATYSCREYLDVGGSHDFFADPCHHGPPRPA